MSNAGQNPYVGPRTFTREEGERFFGRESEARDLLARVISERLVLFYAQSGAGKSSLINTRLIPQLQASGFGVLPVGRVSGTLPPRINAVDNIFVFNLLLSLDQSRGDPQRFSGMSLSHFLTRLTSPDGAHYYYQAEHEAETEEYEAAPSVLIIDQFEEIITTHPEYWSQRAEFFRQLDQAMVADPLLWVVLTLREDYIAALEPYAYLLTDKLRARFYMQRMDYAAALEAVEQPARLGGRPFAPGAAQMLVDNLRQLRSQTPLSPPAAGGSEESSPLQGSVLSLSKEGIRGGVLGQYVEPVQLQVVCYQLWQNLTEKDPPNLTGLEDLSGFSPQITAADLATLGNVDTALAEFYEQTLRAAGPEVSELTLRRWFDDELITEAGTRGIVFQGPHDTAGLPNEVVKRLADLYLLRAEMRAGGTWYELVHDRFVEPIQQANQKWEAERLQRNPLAAPAAAWKNDPAKLLDGAQLAAAQAYAEANPQDVTEEEQAFLEASKRQDAERQQKARETAQRRRVYAGIGLGLIIVFAVLAYWGWQNAIQATEAQAKVAQQLKAAEAELNFYQATDPTDRLAELSKLLTRPDPESQAKARQLFFSLPDVDQFSLLRVADPQLITVIWALLPNLADVNRTGYTDEHLQAMLETLPGLPDAGALPDRLKVWLVARQAARDKEYETARAQYAGLMKAVDDNPALYYERAGVLAALEENQAALADLEQILSLAQNPAYAVIGSLSPGPEFANGEQMIKAVNRLMLVYPKLAQEFENGPVNYPQLVEANLFFPTVITDTKGITMVLVPAGPFKMGSNSGYSNEQPVHQVNLPEFYIDRYEVTNAQYAAFLGEQGNQEEGGAKWLSPDASRLSGEGKVWQIAAGYDDHPVTGVSWYGAKAYCVWRGGRLPTEAEWEKAARGEDQRTYPWGEQISCNLANYYPLDSDKGCADDTTPVGTYLAGVSPYGAYDMAGNVWEWVQSEYKAYPYQTDDGRENLNSTNVRVLRGGSWGIYQDYARATSRSDYYPHRQYANFGFRCVGAAAP